MCVCTGLQTWLSTLQHNPETWTLLIHSLPFTSKETFSILMHCLLPTLSSVVVRTRKQNFSFHSVPLSPNHCVPNSQGLALDFDAAFP